MNPEHDDGAASAGPPALLVLGLGNLLLTDDAVGLELIARLESEWSSGADDPEVEFVDGGTQGLALLGVIAGRHALLVLDAVGLGASPGTVHAMTGEEVLAMHFSRPDTAHDGGAGQLLAIASLTGDLPARVMVVGIEPERVATGLGFSEAVRAALPAAVTRARLAGLELLHDRRERGRRPGGTVHELGLAHDVLRSCAAQVPAGARITRVRVAVGDLAAVEPDLLRFGWQAVVEGTPHAAAEFEIDWRPARQVCESCGDIPERAAGSWLKLCPRCEQPLRVEGGQDLDLVELSYELADEAAIAEGMKTP